MASVASVTGLRERGEALLDVLRATKPWRSWTRYGTARGNVLAGGIAYFAFFSLFPALAVGFTVLGLVLDGDVELQQDLVGYVNQTLGATVIGSGPGDDGLVAIDALVQGDVLTLAGLVGVVTLLVAGLGWIAAIREGVTAVFGRPGEDNPVVTKLRDLLVLGSLGLAVLLSVVLTVAVTSVTDPFVRSLGITTSRGATVVVTAVSSLVLLALDTGVFLACFRVLAGVRLPFGDLLSGALVGALGLAVLKLSGGVLLRTSGSVNRFLAASSIVVGLLVWMNLVGRLILLAAAWAATTAADRGRLPPLPAPFPLPGSDGGEDGGEDRSEDGEGVDRGGGRRRAGRTALQAAPRTAPPERAAEVTSAAAGAVLGVAATVTVALLVRGVRGLVRGLGRGR